MQMGMSVAKIYRIFAINIIPNMDTDTQIE